MISTAVPDAPLYAVRPRELTTYELSDRKGKILLLAPHPDDEALGCGGILAALSSLGARAEVVFLTNGELTKPTSARGTAGSSSRRVECAAEAMRRLGIAQFRTLSALSGRVTHLNLDLVAEIAGALREDLPELILLPHPWERHVDHRGTSGCLGTALAKLYLPERSQPRIVFYEVWTPLPACNAVFDISEYLDAKASAIDCYSSDVIGNLKSALLSLNRYRGISILDRDCHAEAFQEVDFGAFMRMAAKISF